MPLWSGVCATGRECAMKRGAKRPWPQFEWYYVTKLKTKKLFWVELPQGGWSLVWALADSVSVSVSVVSTPAGDG